MTTHDPADPSSRQPASVRTRTGGEVFRRCVRCGAALRPRPAAAHLASASKMDDVVATPTAGEAMRKSMDNEVRRRVRATVATPRFGRTPRLVSVRARATSRVSSPPSSPTRPRAVPVHPLAGRSPLRDVAQPHPDHRCVHHPRTSAPTPSSDRSIHRSIRFVPSGPNNRRRPPLRLSASDSPSRSARPRSPSPIAALAGNIGERHVLVFLGLPLVGKRTIALRLKRYLRFFHGAKCKAFDVSKLRRPRRRFGRGRVRRGGR